MRGSLRPVDQPPGRATGGKISATSTYFLRVATTRNVFTLRMVIVNYYFAALHQ